MNETPFINRFSYIIAGITFVTCFLVFFNDTKAFFGSLSAAIIAGGLVWGTYLILRWLFLANKD